MNRVLWRSLKLIIAAALLVICSVQLLHLNKSIGIEMRLPYPANGQSQRTVQYSGDKFHHHKKEPKTSDEKAISKHSEKDTHIELMQAEQKIPTSNHLFNNTLLLSPQQSHDFSYTPKYDFWPNSENSHDDRILSQMMYTMKEDKPLKKILVYNGLVDGMKLGQGSFIDQKCPVNKCEIVPLSSRGDISSVDLILWQGHVSKPYGKRPPGQIWMVFLLESPYHTPGFYEWKNKVNWTGTYRSDSTIVAPYERFTLYNQSVTQLPLTKNYAEGKTKKVAWFVSNCGARNNRLGYAMELSKYIEVDIYGGCGTKSCPRSSNNECFDMLSTTYKFYLAFENSNCRDYITEKFFVNGLKNDIVPVVMGAHPDDYKRAAPYHSYIHVDDYESPEALAKYLLELDADDEKYNEYFKWKGTGDNINTYFWCRLCAMVHAADDGPSHVYDDLEHWWRGPQVCQELDGKLWPKW